MVLGARSEALGASHELLDRFRGIRCGVHQPSVRDDREMESRHVSIWIDAPPEAVYEFAADPQTWPRWAAGLAEVGFLQTADGWVADSPMGQVTVEFTPPNGFG